MTAIRTTSAVTSQQTQLRQTAQGDVAPDFAPAQIEQFVVGQAVGAKNDSRQAHLRDVLSGMTPDEALAATRTIARQLRQEKAAQSANPDEELSPDWRDGG